MSSTGFVSFRGHQTWYEIYEPERRAPGKLPLLTVHGGPGVPHDYLLSMVDFTEVGRPVIFYDQIGCGNSTHLPDADPSFWTPELFADELDALIAHLGLEEGYHMLGQSWGGMLAQEHAIRQPRNLRGLVLANTAAAFPMFLEAANRWRAELPIEVEATLKEHEAAGTFSDPAYLDACDVFYRRHVCRMDPYPDEVTRAFALLDEDPTVYHTMNGPSEFHVIGTAKDWNSFGRMERIVAHTLILCGQFDEAAPWIQSALVEGIVGSRLHIFEGASHLCQWEVRENYMEVVEAFLAEND